VANRTWTGAHVQQILMSVLRTFHQQGKDAFVSLVELLRIPGHKILEIVPVPRWRKPSRCVGHAQIPTQHGRVVERDPSGLDQAGRG